jgi:hypothetical protein
VATGICDAGLRHLVEPFLLNTQMWTAQSRLTVAAV